MPKRVRRVTTPSDKKRVRELKTETPMWTTFGDGKYAAMFVCRVCEIPVRISGTKHIMDMIDLHIEDFGGYEPLCGSCYDRKHNEK